jgi:purine-binding chemotaxis protein CheW
MPANGSRRCATRPAGRTRTTPTTYLIFSLRRADMGACPYYGVEAIAVREILALPALTPLDETPPDVVGMLNLRGTLIPVFDLDRRLGRAAEPYRLSDRLVVLEWEDRLAGMIVHDVHGVKLIDPGAIEESHACRFTGIAKIEEGLVMLLRLDRLLALPEIDPDAGGREPGSRDAGNGPSEAERVIFLERARALARPVESQDVGDLRPLAVVRLSDEPFGIDLAAVREFSPLRQVTPVPCCPPHVVGQMNLRGDILTLVEIRGVLGLPAADGGKRKTLSALHPHEGSVMVVQAGPLTCGVLVDEVLDVVYLRPDEITEVPVAVRALAHDFVTGTAPFGGRLLTLLDLSRLLARGDLVVNEEP